VGELLEIVRDMIDTAVQAERDACKRVLIDEAAMLTRQAESLEAFRDGRYRELSVGKRETADLLQLIAETFDRPDRDLGELQRERFDQAVRELRERHSRVVTAS
jgi:hypothetical protein